MKEPNAINKKEEVCCETMQHEKTIEDELRWAKIRIEELINERNDLLDKLKKEEQRKDVLVATLSEEHRKKVIAFEQTEWYIKRTDAYRKAINEISEKCRNILKDSNDISKPVVEQLAKEIFDITYRF